MFFREVSILNFVIILLCKFNIYFYLIGGGGCWDFFRFVYVNFYFFDSVIFNENIMLIIKYDIFSRNLYLCENEYKVFIFI